MRDTKKTFSLIRNLTQIKASAPIVQAIASSSGDETTADPSEIKVIVKSYFERLYNTQSSHHEVQELDSNWALTPNLFTKEDLLLAIDCCNFGKAIGPDMFDGSILKQDEEIKNKCAIYLAEALNKN